MLHPELDAWVAKLAWDARDANVPVMLVVYQTLLSRPPPPEGAEYSAWPWLSGANNAVIATHALGLYDESAALADLVTPHAHRNSHITHSAACSYAAVGRYDDALEQVRLAVALGYPYLDRLRTDPDLGEVLGLPEFQALFN